LPSGGTWSADGVILFSGDLRQLSRVSASGGLQNAVTQIQSGQNIHRFPQFLPGGRNFVFWGLHSQEEAAGLYFGSLDSSEIRRVTAADSSGIFLPGGWLLFVRDRRLIAQQFDPAKGTLRGDAVTVAEGLNVEPAIALGAFSAAESGLIAYRAGGIPDERQLAWFDRSGKKLSTAAKGNVFDAELSRDGHRIAIRRVLQNNQDVWLIDGDRTSRVTFDASIDRFPTWSPDGTQIVFQSYRKGPGDLYEKRVTGGSTETLLVQSQQIKAPNSWSSDGRFLIYYSIDPITGRDLWVLPMEGDRKPRVFLRTEFEERTADFSPDVHWVAYQSNESGRDEIYVRPFPEAPGQWQISTSGGVQPRWRADGKELYYLSPDGTLMAVPVAIRATTVEPGTPAALFRTDIANVGAFRQQYAVASDARFLMLVTSKQATASPITLLQNWKPKP
jgi:hypothetical protein